MIWALVDGLAFATGFALLGWLYVRLVDQRDLPRWPRARRGEGGG